MYCQTMQILFGKIFLFTIERNIFHQYYLEIADAGC